MKRIGYAVLTVAALAFGGWLGSDGVAAASSMQCGVGDICLGPYRVSNAQPSDTEVLTWSDSNNQWEPAAAAGGSSDIVSEGNSNVEVIDTGTGQIDLDLDGNPQGRMTAASFTLGVTSATQQLIVPISNDDVTPTLAFGDGDSGFYEYTDDGIKLSLAGSQKWVFASASMGSVTGNNFIQAEVPSATNPVFVLNNDFDSGLGWSGADAPSLVAGGVEALRATELSSGVVLQYQTTAGITASVTQTQGQQALVSTLNEVSTVANVNDVVTLPSAITGSCVKIINNGANTLQVFPASGDSVAGGSVDASTTLNSGSNAEYCAFNATAWEVF